MYAGKTIFRGLFLKNSRVQIQRENQKVGQSCLHLLAQGSSMDEGNRAWGLGGKELSPIQQGRAVVGFPKIEKEGGEIGAAIEVGVVRETLAPRQPFWGLGKGWGRPKP